MKVYIVERGCYSDRYVAGIFSTRELAESNISMHGPDDAWNSAGSVEEYELDEQAEHIKRHIWTSQIDLESGAIFSRRDWDTFDDPHAPSREPEISDFRYMAKAKGLSPSFGRISGETYSYLGSDNADKLAAEFRQNWLRENAVTATEV